MRTISTLLLLALSAFVTVHADNVTEQEAMNVARQFIVNHQTGSRKVSLQLHLAKKAMSKSGDVDYYVFSRGADQGFVVVGGDDRALPVWGYSNEGTFNGEDMPENVAWWMEEYQRQLEFLRQHPDAARQPRRLSTSVDPLMTTKWKQGTPYNQEIPSIRFPLGTYKPAVGCVALAMAQMMKAHNWPTTGEGSHSYSWQPEGAQRATTFSADFGNTTYQWASMKDSYSSSQDATAVGTLCYHAGVAVDMMYNTADNGGSGAQIYDAMKALRNYFRYDKGLDLYLRDFYPLDTWEQMLRDDLDQGNPIIYGGSTVNMYGHCFVFDGYDADGKFHINWGWGGDYNGWFVSSVLDSGRSGADFSSWQQAILGAKPDRDGTSSGSSLRPLTGYLIDLEATKSQVVVGGSVNLKIEGITFLGEGSYTLNYCGVEIVTDDEQTVVKDEWQADCSAMKVGESYAIDESAAVSIPKDIPEGTYRIYGVYALDDEDAQNPIRYERPPSKPKYIKMVVKNSIAYFSDGDVEPVVSTPSLMVRPSELAFQCEEESTESQTFTVSGADLQQDVMLTIEGDPVFSLSTTTLPVEDVDQKEATVTVTFAPETAGNYLATLTIASGGAESVVISLTGEATEKIPDVPPTPTGITHHSSSPLLPPSEVYNLQGSRMNSSPSSINKGVFIVNGKKVIIK